MMPFNPVPKPQKRPTKTITCRECGNEFERRTDLINKQHSNNYCGNKCANVANARKRIGSTLPSKRTGKEIECKHCGKSFYVSGSRLSRGAKFCSRSCASRASLETNQNFIRSCDNRGIKNGRYKHGRKVGRHVNKNKLRQTIAERDGNYCLLCGKPPGGLHIHRVVYGAQGGKYEIENCVQLCVDHHGLVHSSKKKWQPLLLDYLNSKDASKLRNVFAQTLKQTEKITYNGYGMPIKKDYLLKFYPDIYDEE